MDYENASRLYVKACKRMENIGTEFFNVPSYMIGLYETLVRICQICQEGASVCKNYSALLKEKVGIAQNLGRDKSLLSADSYSLLEAVAIDSLNKSADITDSIDRFEETAKKCVYAIQNMLNKPGF